MCYSCFGNSLKETKTRSKLLYGNQRTEAYLSKLTGKRVGVLVHHTSVIDSVHLIDTLLSAGINVNSIFVPEHGYRGTADAGEVVKGGIDTKTGLPIISLYGKNKKPQSEDVKDLDVIVVDLQDVGVRFYTYLSTLHYVMEACAENGVKVLLLDRPNPNGDYIDGPVLQPKFRSFVGMHPIPVVHGMTMGELAQMINGEQWLKNGIQCKLIVIKMEEYNRKELYDLPIKPSPNLPNQLSIRLYPSLCFFEATQISIGRGTHFPFQVIGYPKRKYGTFEFKPVSIAGMSKYPKHEDTKCYGVDLRGKRVNDSRFTLTYLVEFYSKWNEPDEFFDRRNWFNLLAGNDWLLKQIESGMSEEAIRETWQDDLNDFKVKRKKYLLYDE